MKSGKPQTTLWLRLFIAEGLFAVILPKKGDAKKGGMAVRGTLWR